MKVILEYPTLYDEEVKLVFQMLYADTSVSKVIRQEYCDKVFYKRVKVWFRSEGILSVFLREVNECLHYPVIMVRRCLF